MPPAFLGHIPDPKHHGNILSRDVIWRTELTQARLVDARVRFHPSILKLAFSVPSPASLSSLPKTVQAHYLSIDPMLARLTCIALLAWPANAFAQDNQSRSEQAAEKLVERTKTEARAVLAAVLRDDKIKITPCLLDTSWSTRPITADIAQTYLGSSINADVVASDLGVSPADLIDPGNTMGGSACSDAHADALWQQMKDDFRSGANPGQRGDAEGNTSTRSSRLRLLRAETTLPVFNQAFTTAAVVVGYNSVYTWKTDAESSRKYPDIYDEAGYYRRSMVEGFGYTYVYRKRGGRWVRVHETNDWSAH